jgi:PhnB protein
MAKVKAVPEGYHTITPFLTLKGADKAIEFYKQAFGCEERFRMPGPGGAVMHAEMQLGDSILMLSEAMQDPPTVGGIFIYTQDVDALYNRAIKAGCKSKMPVENQFWGDRFGKVVDPFGITWSMATHVEDVAPEEMEKRMKAAMANMPKS